MSRWMKNCSWGLIFLSAAGQVAASPMSELAFQDPDLFIPAQVLPISELPEEVAEQAKQELAALGVDELNGYLDTASERWATLMMSEPLIPGEGAGNNLSWADWGLPGPPDLRTLETIATDALLGYIVIHEAEFELAASELEYPPRVAIHDGGELIQITVRRMLDGIPVKGSFVGATIKLGNLILFGAALWDDLDPTLPSQLALSAEDARAKVLDYLADVTDVTVEGSWGEPELLIVPMRGEDPDGDGDGDDPPGDGDGKAGLKSTVGAGYRYRPAWAVRPLVAGDVGRWEVVVGADDATILEISDKLARQRQVVGGVYPLTNNGAPPGGVEQTYPMPYADLTNGAGAVAFTDGSGYTPMFPTGTVTTNLDGLYVQIFDSCGAVSESTTGNVLDLGTSAGTDCAVPAGGSAGDTHASRTAYSELNRIKEMGRGQLPTNTWLQDLLPVDTNAPIACGASWNGLALTFSQSAPGCANPGELAGMIDHEWGHGMDENGPPMTGLSRPAEGIADTYATLRLNDSCIGRGLNLGAACPGCLSCDGVRDVDYANVAPGSPHDLFWITGNCPAPAPGLRDGPCGLDAGCEGLAVSEAIWDLWNRDLVSPPFNMDFNTALELATRLTYLGAGMPADWFQCMVGFGGCNLNSGYTSFLTVDDDDGDLTNGTPHMSAIFAAFNRHGIACGAGTPTSVCASIPTTAPVVAVTPMNRAARLDWAAVPNAVTYRVSRTEGIPGCNFGKTLVAEVTATTYTDTGLQNGRDYFYVVIPVGTRATCSGPASSCTTVTPSPPPPPLVSSCGDCDGDGTITALDALRAAMHSAGTVLITDLGLLDCDVDRSGIINVVDALIMAQEAAGLMPGLDCPSCLDCDWNGTPGESTDLAAISARVASDVVTPRDAVCDLNGDLRIDARDVVDFSPGAKCITCGDTNQSGKIDFDDRFLPVPFPQVPGTRRHAASDVVPAAGAVDILDAQRIATYTDGFVADLVCFDPGAGSPRPRIISWMGNYCVTGTSNGTPFSATLSATSPGVVGPVAGGSTADLAALWVSEINMNADYQAMPVMPASGHCFEVRDTAGMPPLPVTIVVDGTCDPDISPTGCPFG